MQLYCFLFLIVFTAFVKSEDKLIHVHGVWRHGERNPGKMMPGDLNNISDFPEGLTQLTKNGIHQLFTLGQKFQERYIKSYQLLSPKYQNSEIYSRSTDADRAIVSAMAFFGGLFSNESSQEPFFTPIPVHSIPASEDFLNLLSFECETKKELWNLVQKSQVVKMLINNSHDLLMEITNKTGGSEENFDEIMYIFDAAFFETLIGLPIPEWLKPLVPDLEALFANYIATLWGFIPFPDVSFGFALQLELTKISSGPLIAEIVDRLVLKTQCLLANSTTREEEKCSTISNQKLYTYSGHDITEISLLAGLGFESFVLDGKLAMPSVSSSIVLELWETEEIGNVAISEKNYEEYYYVKILYYQNASVEEPKNIGSLLPECQGKGCPLRYLIQRADLLRPKPDWKTFCNTPIMSGGSKHGYSLSLLSVAFIIFYFKEIF